MATTFYLCTSGGTPSTETYDKGRSSTTKFYTTGSTIPEPIFYDSSTNFPVTEGTYYSADDDSFGTVYKLTVDRANKLTAKDEVNSGDSVMLPSCNYLGKKLETDPQSLVNDVRAELIKLRNNPMALGTITNRIVYLIMNGQAAPRAYDTRFVKPVRTVERIYKRAKDGSDDGEAARFTYTQFDGRANNGVLYYAGGTRIGLGTYVFKDTELKNSDVPDGRYSNDTNSATASRGRVTDYR